MRLIFLLLLSGCAQAPYWVKTHDPVAVKRVQYVDAPCGRPEINGCAIRDAATIQIKRGLDEATRWCAEHHERKHMAGYGHDRRMVFALDCGNGETL